MESLLCVYHNPVSLFFLNRIRKNRLERGKLYAAKNLFFGGNKILEREKKNFLFRSFWKRLWEKNVLWFCNVFRMRIFSRFLAGFLRRKIFTTKALPVIWTGQHIIKSFLFALKKKERDFPQGKNVESAFPIFLSKLFLFPFLTCCRPISLYSYNSCSFFFF